MKNLKNYQGPPIHCAYNKLTATAKIIPNPRNPNTHPDAQIKLLSQIIDAQGWRAPITVSKRSGFVVRGHGRLLAAQLLSLEKVPVDVQDYANEAEEWADLIADNKIAELAEVDEELLSELLAGMDEETRALTGMMDDELERLLEGDGVDGNTDDDDAPGVPEEPKSRLGDLYLLGDHRVLCGDATKAKDVERLMDGEKADITITSPPYNMGKNIRGSLYKNDKDNKSSEDYLSLLLDASKLSLDFSRFVFWNIQLLESNKHIIIDFQTKRRDSIKDILIWNKSQYPPHINKGTFGTKWEYVFVFSKESKSRSFPSSWQGKYPNVIETENASQNQYSHIHKATFPVAFPLWILETMDFSVSVYDPFGGSGSTLIACEKTGRKCRMMELDPGYVDVIVQRWEDFTGKTAVLERRGEESPIG